MQAQVSGAVLSVLAATFGVPALAQTAPPLPQVAVTAFAPIAQDSNVVGRDGNYSVGVGTQSYWAFRDTGLTGANASGTGFIHNSLAVASSLDAGKGIDLDKNLVDDTGLPKQFVPFTAAERAFNAAHKKTGTGTNDCAAGTGCGDSYAIWPGAIAYDPASGTVIVPFSENEDGPDAQYVGTGFAIGTVGSKGWLRLVRPKQNPDAGAANPTLMWSSAEKYFGTNDAFVYDGYLYAYGTTDVGYGYPGQLLARVLVADITTKSDWQYYAGSGNWSASSADAVSTFTGGLDGTTVFFDNYLGQWVATYMGMYDGVLHFRVANLLVGPWSAEGTLTTALVGANGAFGTEGHAHPEFSPDGGQTEYLTYSLLTGSTGGTYPIATYEQPLVKFVFTKPQ